jgi:hypothetical protein
VLLLLLLLALELLGAPWLDGGGVLLVVPLLLSDVVGGGVLLPSPLLAMLSVVPSLDVVDGRGVLLPPLLLSLALLEGVDAAAVVSSCLFFVLLESSEGIVGGHFPFTGVEPSGHGVDRGLMLLLLSPLSLSLALLDGVDAAAVVSSDVRFFAAETP